MRQVKLIETTFTRDLERQINDFLATKRFDEIIDIKITTQPGTSDTHESVIAMIVYRVVAEQQQQQQEGYAIPHMDVS